MKLPPCFIIPYRQCLEMGKTVILSEKLSAGKSTGTGDAWTSSARTHSLSDPYPLLMAFGCTPRLMAFPSHCEEGSNEGAGAGISAVGAHSFEVVPSWDKRCSIFSF